MAAGLPSFTPAELMKVGIVGRMFAYALVQGEDSDASPSPRLPPQATEGTEIRNTLSVVGERLAFGTTKGSLNVFHHVFLLLLPACFYAD